MKVIFVACGLLVSTACAVAIHTEAKKLIQLMDDAAENSNFEEPDISCRKIIAGMPNPPQIIVDDSAPFPFYIPEKDTIFIPEYSGNQYMFYSSLFHELAHSTIHESRLSIRYDRVCEEIIAELTAVALGKYCGLTFVTFGASYDYIVGWAIASPYYEGIYLTEDQILNVVEARTKYILNIKD